MNPKHGYTVIQEIKEWTSDEVVLAAGTMYSALENLTKKGWIVSVENDNKRRKVYVITEQGESVIAKDYKRMLRNVGLYHKRSIKNGGKDDAEAKDMDNIRK
ncbi:hypothetical protein RyT2_20900 [Pseudolactococcus yaeyamensis]